MLLVLVVVVSSATTMEDEDEELNLLPSDLLRMSPLMEVRKRVLRIRWRKLVMIFERRRLKAWAVEKRLVGDVVGESGESGDTGGRNEPSAAVVVNGDSSGWDDLLWWKAAEFESDEVC